MSTLAEVLPFLEAGHIVRNARGESFEAETVTLA